MVTKTDSSLIVHDGGTIKDALDKTKPIADYVALRAYTGTATQVRIMSNGIAGFFYYDASDTSSTDNGGTVIVSSNGKRWKRLFDGAVNVMWFGAKGDWNGTTGTDDTQSIQNAANSARQIIIPANFSFRITSEIIFPASAHVSGEGAIVVDQSIYTRAFQVGSDSVVDGLIFRGNGVATSVLDSLAGGTKGLAIACVGGQNVKIKNCKFYNFLSTGLNTGAAIIAASTTYNFEVSGCYFDNTNDGFGDIDASYYVGDCIFNGNISYSNSDIFIGVSSVGSGFLIGSTQVSVTAHHVVTNNIHIKNRWANPSAGRTLGRHGVLAHYDAGISYLTASNNIIGNVSRHGFYLRGPSTDPLALAGPNIISNNFILYCGSGEPSGYCSGIRVETTLPTTITGNYIYKSGYTPSGIAGIYPAYDVETVRGAQDVIVSNNTMTDGKDGAVIFSTTVAGRSIKNIKVTGNNIKTSTYGIAISPQGPSGTLSDFRINGNHITLTGANTVNNKAFGIITEIVDTTVVMGYGIDIHDNAITGTGKATGQYGIAIETTGTNENKIFIRDNTLRSLQVGLSSFRALNDAVSYVVHRRIGTSVQFIRNRFVSCGQAIFTPKTISSLLAISDESNIFDDCDSGKPTTTITWDAPVSGKFTGFDSAGNMLIEYKATSAPTAQQYYAGDRVVNSLATLGGSAGWLCIVSGIPGTWVPFGQVGALTSISSAPAFVLQQAVVGGVGYLATGTASAADWKQITN